MRGTWERGAGTMQNKTAWSLQLLQLCIKHLVQTGPYKIPSVGSMQHRSQDASLYSAIKLGQN